MLPLDQTFQVVLGKPSFVEFARTYSTPEWFSVLILLIQAGIFWRQTTILERHGESLEKSAEIANAQAKIAAQQEAILTQQFTFQKRVEAKAEREKLFDLILDVRSRVKNLASTIETAVYGSEQIKFAWDKLGETILPCMKALITSIHLSAPEQKYFLAYVSEVDELKQTNDLTRDAAQLRAIDAKYADFEKRMISAAQTPTNV
jgi:hypothetical protein